MVTTAQNDHYDQAMWCKGQLTIGGEAVHLDGPAFRDRSWGTQRPEESIKHPPLAYIFGVMDGGGEAFNFRIGDDLSKGTEWTDTYDLSPRQMFHGGWFQTNGETRAIVKASRTSKRDPRNMMKPMELRIDFEDSAGQQQVLVGQPKSSFWFFLGATFSLGSCTWSGTLTERPDMEKFRTSLGRTTAAASGTTNLPYIPICC